ncbi:hypothetical protein [Paenibacillus sp.]|uniref:hypothetical protein n=1 Tax=Paenibacillus sp. TaxID=58172 RepID=UPI002D6D04B8|nr:hypothetical protein [Paenibacillus sp.]HZG87705.1 hypothetical protein [Paenibacillus sp.]
MRFTIQYIPLKQIHAGAPVRMTDRIKQLRRVIWDSPQLLAVTKNRKGGYTVVGGHDRYRYLKAHTDKMYAPCVLDDRREKRGISVPAWLKRMRGRGFAAALPKMHPENVTPAGWSIIRAFLKEEPRFAGLTRMQQARILLVGVRYKRTVVREMKRMVDELLGPGAS